MNRTWSHLQRSRCTKLIFNVNSRRVTPWQSLDSNTAFFFIRSDSILISTHPKQKLQIQDKIIYALLSSVSSEKNITFYQNPRCLSKEYSWTSEITAKTELLKHWLYQEKVSKKENAWAYIGFVIYWTRRAKHFTFTGLVWSAVLE